MKIDKEATTSCGLLKKIVKNATNAKIKETTSTMSTLKFNPTNTESERISVNNDVIIYSIILNFHVYTLIHISPRYKFYP